MSENIAESAERAERIADAELSVRLAQLDEIADGAWGDGPLTRGRARDEAARIRASMKAEDTHK